MDASEEKASCKQGTWFSYQHNSGQGHITAAERTLRPDYPYFVLDGAVKDVASTGRLLPILLAMLLAQDALLLSVAISHARESSLLRYAFRGLAKVFDHILLGFSFGFSFLSRFIVRTIHDIIHTPLRQQVVILHNSIKTLEFDKAMAAISSKRTIHELRESIAKLKSDKNALILKLSTERNSYYAKSRRLQEEKSKYLILLHEAIAAKDALQNEVDTFRDDQKHRQISLKAKKASHHPMNDFPAGQCTSFIVSPEEMPSDTDFDGDTSLMGDISQSKAISTSMNALEQRLFAAEEVASKRLEETDALKQELAKLAILSAARLQENNALKEERHASSTVNLNRSKMASPAVQHPTALDTSRAVSIQEVDSLNRQFNVARESMSSILHDVADLKRRLGSVNKMKSAALWDLSDLMKQLYAENAGSLVSTSQPTVSTQRLDAGDRPIGTWLENSEQGSTEEGRTV